MATLNEQLAIILKHQIKPPVDLIAIARDLDLSIFRANNWSNDLSGMIRKAPDNPEHYNIYVNAKHHENRRRFTIAHEMAHFILHRDLIGDGIVDDALYRSKLSNNIEAQANRQAADILMPFHLINPLIDAGVTDIQELADHFNVSANAISIRLGVPYEATAV